MRKFIKKSLIAFTLIASILISNNSVNADYYGESADRQKGLPRLQVKLVSIIFRPSIIFRLLCKAVCFLMKGRVGLIMYRLQ